MCVADKMGKFKAIEMKVIDAKRHSGIVSSEKNQQCTKSTSCRYRERIRTNKNKEKM